MKEIINIISDINICFLILDILVFIVLLLFIRKHNLSRIQLIVLITMYIIANIFLFKYYYPRCICFKILISKSLFNYFNNY